MTDWTVYVLLNAAGTTYTGTAVDAEARLIQHNGGAGAKLTRGGGPWRIINADYAGRARCNDSPHTLMYAPGYIGTGELLRLTMGIKLVLMKS